MKINAVDLFCGVGGLTCGIQKSGINVIAGYDIDSKSEYAYEHNNSAEFILKDVKDIDDEEINLDIDGDEGPKLPVNIKILKEAVEVYMPR